MNFRVFSFQHIFARALAVCVFLVSPAIVGASSIDWATWSSVTAGSPGTATGSLPLSAPIGLSYAGQTNGLLTAYPSWTPTGSYSGGTVSNAPPSANNSVSLQGGTTGVNSISFSSPVLNPVFAIWSLGNFTGPATFVFTNSEPFTLQAGGPNAEYGGGSITVSGNTVSGMEGNGVIQFNGTYSQLTWTNPVSENYYAFTVGVPTQTPEPAEFTLVLTGLLAVVAMRHRRILR